MEKVRKLTQDYLQTSPNIKRNIEFFSTTKIGVEMIIKKSREKTFFF